MDESLQGVLQDNGSEGAPKIPVRVANKKRSFSATEGRFEKY